MNAAPLRQSLLLAGLAFLRIASVAGLAVAAPRASDKAIALHINRAGEHVRSKVAQPTWNPRPLSIGDEGIVIESLHDGRIRIDFGGSPTLQGTLYPSQLEAVSSASPRNSDSKSKSLLRLNSKLPLDYWTPSGINQIHQDMQDADLGPHSAHWYETSQDEWDGRHMYGANSAWRQYDGQEWSPEGRFGRNDEEGVHTRPYIWRAVDKGWGELSYHLPTSFHGAARSWQCFSILVTMTVAAGMAMQLAL